MRRFLIATTAAAALALGTACSAEVSVGDKALSQEKVEKQVSSELEKTVGFAPDSVTCPDDLKAEVGTTMRCKLTSGGDTLGVSLKVTEVKGSDVKFSIKVDEKGTSS